MADVITYITEFNWFILISASLIGLLLLVSSIKNLKNDSNEHIIPLGIGKGLGPSSLQDLFVGFLILILCLIAALLKIRS